MNPISCIVILICGCAQIGVASLAGAAEAGASVEGAATDVGAVFELENRLRKRRMDDLRKLLAITDAAERPEVQLILAETLVEHGQALGRDEVPDAATDLTERDRVAARIYSEAIDLLTDVHHADDDSPVRSRAGLLLADLLTAQGRVDDAQKVLEFVESQATSARLRARAAERAGRLLASTSDQGDQQRALDAFERALLERPTVANRLGAARAAEQIGEIETALTHYRILLELEPDPTDLAGQDARRSAARAIALIVSRWEPSERGLEFVATLGRPGHRVWASIGGSYHRRQLYSPAWTALNHAVELEPDPGRRFRARCDVIDAGLHLGEWDAVAAHVQALTDELSEARARQPEWLASVTRRAERAVRLTIQHIHDDGDRWRDDLADGIIAAYLAAFPEAPAESTVRLARGARIARRAETCDAWRAAAADMAYAFRHAPKADERVRVEAGVGALRMLAACRPDANDESGRPQPAPTDVALLDLAAKVMSAELGPQDSGEVLLIVGRAHLARSEDDEARSALARAVEFDGEHLEEVAGTLVRSWALGGEHLEVEARAMELHADRRLTPEMRALMKSTAVDAALTHARAVEGVERGRRLVAVVDRHLDTNRAIAILVEAGAVFLAERSGSDAADALARARALETAETAGPAHIAWAELLDAQGRFEDAAEIYARVAIGDADTLDDDQRDVARARARVRFEMIGRALDALELHPEGLDEQRRLTDGMLLIADGHPELAAARVEGLRARTRATRTLLRSVEACGRRTPEEVTESYRGVRKPDDLLRAATAYCLTWHLEDGLGDPLPPDPVERAGQIRRRLPADEALVAAVDDLQFADATARSLLVLARKWSAVASALGSSPQLSPESRAELAEPASLAWRFWAIAARIADDLEDPRLHRQVGEALVVLTAETDAASRPLPAMEAVK